jgi:hypothetical protein
MDGVYVLSLRTRLCMYLSLSLSLRVRMCVHMCVRMCVRMCVWACGCARILTHTFDVRACVYTHTFTHMP